MVRNLDLLTGVLKSRRSQDSAERDHFPIAVYKCFGKFLLKFKGKKHLVAVFSFLIAWGSQEKINSKIQAMDIAADRYLSESGMKVCCFSDQKVNK